MPMYVSTKTGVSFSDTQVSPADLAKYLADGTFVPAVLTPGGTYVPASGTSVQGSTGYTYTNGVRTSTTPPANFNYADAWAQQAAANAAAGITPEGSGGSGGGSPASGNGDLNMSGMLLDQLRASFPWIDAIGLSPEFFRELVANAASGAEIITTLRAQPQYRARFPGLWRDDGSVRMTEAEYLSRETDYRSVLRQFGFADGYQDAMSLSQFFNAEMDPNELRDRLTVYKGVQDSGQAVKDAFYVYAGMRVSDTDLYSAIVDPGGAGASLTSQYDESIAKNPFDYTTWITRATEVGLERVSATLRDLQSAGAVTGTAVQQIQRVDPNFARQVMDVIYNAGGTGPQLNLQELLSSFEYAAIGAAATNAGLLLPGRERVAEIRAAGVDRARASQSYLEYGLNKGVYDAASQRMGMGGFDQSEFESAAFLGNAAAANELRAILSREDAAGRSSGTFRFEQDRYGRLNQTGFESAFQG
jgi:hypothetical protein